MGRLLGWLLVAVIVMLVCVPALIARGCGADDPQKMPSEPQDASPVVHLYLNDEQRLIELPLEQYLVGVVAAEMPAAFHFEALKAGAVAARTYTVKRLRALGASGCNRHPLADICDDPAHHQAWLSSEQLFDKWSLWSYSRNLRKIKQAVQDTAGLVITWNGEPIDAVYHSTCGGKTESALEAWGTDVPHLQSVECAWDRHSPRYESVVRLSRQDVADKLGLDKPVKTLESINWTSTGRTRSVLADGQVFAASEFRSRLGLRSNWFTINSTKDGWQISVKGYGHGVGLCQYGADGLGRTGAEFTDILGHYYPGTSLTSLDYETTSSHGRSDTDAT